MKKSLIVSLLAASLGLVGCQQDSGSSTDMQNTGTNASSSSMSSQPASTPAEKPVATPAKATDEKKS